MNEDFKGGNGNGCPFNRPVIGPGPGLEEREIVYSAVGKGIVTR